MRTTYTYRLNGNNTFDLLALDTDSYPINGVTVAFEAKHHAEAENLVADLATTYRRHIESWNKPKMRKWVRNQLPLGVVATTEMMRRCAEKTNGPNEISDVATNEIHSVNKPADVEVFGIVWKEK